MAGRNLGRAADGWRRGRDVVEVLEARRLLSVKYIEVGYVPPAQETSGPLPVITELAVPDPRIRFRPVGRATPSLQPSSPPASPPSSPSGPPLPTPSPEPASTPALPPAGVADEPVALVEPDAAAVAAPAGALSGKVVYVSPGHGWYRNNTSWTTQRGNNNSIVEDFGNQDQATFYAEYLLRAGATVVPTRPVGHQTNEVIVDNLDAGFSVQSGSWSVGTFAPYWSNNGGTGDRYRSATVSATETAVARFTPNLPSAGWYPVYAWALNGSNRSTEQLFRVNSAGGSQEVKVNLKLTGKGWVYLGTYYFDAGTGGNVEVSNKAGNGTAVIADAIRFGNGMGDVTYRYTYPGGVETLTTIPASGKPREEESPLYWAYRSRGYTGAGTLVSNTTVNGGLNDGTTDSDTTADWEQGVGAPPRWSAYMNDETQGVMTDRLFLSFHSNAGGGRGSTSLINSGAPTPNQATWAGLMSADVEGDMIALGTAGLIEHTWGNYSNTYSGAYGEISNNTIDGEFDATLLEVAFHDNLQDAQLMLDPKVRDWVGRAAYQATVKYFDQVGTSTNGTVIPDSPTNVRAVTTAAGAVTVSWTAPATGSTTGNSGAATGYKILTSANGLGWSEAVTLGNVTSHTFTGLSTSAPTYFKVVATNAGGESLQRDVVVAKPHAGRTAPVLIVNGFDRLDRTGNQLQAYGTGTTQRVRWRYQNTRDYVIPFADAIKAFNPNVGFDTVQNEHVISGAVNLGNYQAVLWISGEESTAHRTFDATEQSKVAAYVAGGGKFFASGAELGWDLQQAGNGTSFFNNTLKASYASDDAGTYTTNGVSGSIFAGVTSVVFDNGAGEGRYGTYDVDTPDVLAVSAGSTAALTYSTGTTAAVQWDGGSSKVVTMGFPFETITTAAKRNQVMAGVLNFFDLDVSITPGVPDLVAAYDTGTSSTDNVTRLNNSASGNALQFTVPNTVANAVVRLYAGGTLIGQATASGSSTTVTTNGTFTLGDGVHAITATQMEPGLAASAASAALTIGIDTVAPTVLLAGVASPRQTAVASEGVTFSENVAGLTLSNFGLTRDGAATSLVSASVSGSGGAYALANLSAATERAGSYVLTLSPGGVTDVAGNALGGGASVAWMMNAVNGTAGADQISVARTPGGITQATVVVNGSGYSVKLDGLGQLIVNGQGGADTLTLNLASGAPVFDPGAGISYNAAGAVGSELVVVGTGGSDVMDLSATQATVGATTVTFAGPGPDNVRFEGGAGDDTLNVSGRAVAFISDASATTANLSLNLLAGASATFGATQHLAGLVVGNGATAMIAGGGNKVLVTKALSVGATGRLDLTDNDLVLDYDGATPLAEVRAALASGYAGGAWTGYGIVSSTAAADPDQVTGVGYAEATQLWSAQFGGEELDGTALVLKYTYHADTNLDGLVDPDDLVKTDRGLLFNRTEWVAGDSNYDGVVDATDVDRAGVAYVRQGGVL